MTNCFYVLLATLATGGPGYNANNNAPPPTPVIQQETVPLLEYVAPVEEPGLFGRLRRFLGERPEGKAMFVVPAEVVPAPTAGLAAAPASPLNFGEELSEPPLNLQVAKKYQDRVGHEDDYSWVTGHLFYVRADGGHWVLRYALPDQVDRYGGSIVLAPGVDMKNFREGDLVCVFGHLLSEGRTSPALAAPLYRVDVINIVERADP
jgi:hypothetical protein